MLTVWKIGLRFHLLISGYERVAGILIIFSLEEKGPQQFS